MYRARVQQLVASRWNSLPNVVERWSVTNAVLAVAAAAVSVGVHDVRPLLLICVSSLAWLCFRAAPRGVGIASAITAGRMSILCAAIGFVPARGAWVAGAAFVNFTLDGVDGWAARKFGQTSEFGARLDMESDSHSVLLLDVLLVAHAGYPAWVLWAGVLRYAFVLSRFAAGPRELRERRSQLTRWIFSLVFVSRTFACLPGVHAVAVPLLAVATLAVTASFAPDFYALRPGSRA